MDWKVSPKENDRRKRRLSLPDAKCIHNIHWKADGNAYHSNQASVRNCQNISKDHVHRNCLLKNHISKREIVPAIHDSWWRTLEYSIDNTACSIAIGAAKDKIKESRWTMVQDSCIHTDIWCVCGLFSNPCWSCAWTQGEEKGMGESQGSINVIFRYEGYDSMFIYNNDSRK